MKKFLPWLILIVAIVLAGFICLIEIQRFAKFIEYGTTLNFSSQLNKEKTINIILVGDIMLDRGVEYQVLKTGDGDFKFPFLKIAEELNKADIVFGNLEGPISDQGEKVGSIYSFRMNPEAITGLTYASFNVLSLANNHMFDYGRRALEDTLNRLKEAKIDYVGAGFNVTETFSAVIKEINGSAGSPPVRVAFLAYTNLGSENWRSQGENSGMAWISENDFERIKEDIKSAKQNSDILIVSLHAGEEYQKMPDKFQTDFSKMAVDAGADIVVGHHPHVVQTDKISNNKYVFYSLGNFVFDQNFSEETMESQMVKILIKGKRIKQVIPIDIKINEFFQPCLPVEKF